MTMFVFRGFRNPVSATMLVVLGLGLAGCTNNPLSPFDDDGVVRQTTRSVGLSPKPVQAPGFVESSRPEKLEFVPVGVTPPARTPLSNPKAVEAELAAKAAANSLAVAAPQPASPYAGKIEPGYKPPPPAPLPPGGPELSLPNKTANAPAGQTPAKARPASMRKAESAEAKKQRKQRAAQSSGETN